MQPHLRSRCVTLSDEPLRCCALLAGDLSRVFESSHRCFHAESKCSGVWLHPASPTKAICCPSTDAASDSSGAAQSRVCPFFLHQRWKRWWGCTLLEHSQLQYRGSCGLLLSRDTRSAIQQGLTLLVLHSTLSSRTNTPSTGSTRGRMEPRDHLGGAMIRDPRYDNTAPTL